LPKIPQKPQQPSKYPYSSEVNKCDNGENYRKWSHYRHKYEEYKRKYERTNEVDYMELMILYLEEYNRCKEVR